MKFKKILLTSLIIGSALLAFSSTNALQDNRGLYGDEPVNVLDNVVAKAQGSSEIQETMLNNANADEGGYIKNYKIANTLDYLRKNIAPYLQWMVFIGLTLGVILIIYNGFLMVTNGIHKQGDMAKVKKNLVNISIGVVLLTGFYALVKILVGLINTVFGGSGSSVF